jgi:hypothetical protein
LKDPSEHKKSVSFLNLLDTLISSLVALLTVFSGQQERCEIQHLEGRSDDATRHCEINAASPVRIIVDSVPPPPPPQTEEQKAKESRAEEREQKKYRMETITAVGAAGLLIANAGLWYSQVKSMKVDQRAWVGLDKPMVADKINLPGPRLSDDPNPLIRTGVSMKNFGKTPAFDVVVDVFSSNLEMLDIESNTQCKFAEDFSSGRTLRDNKQNNLKWRTIGKTIFPGQPIFEPEDVPGGDIPRLFIVGCIAYRDAFNERHHTRFCYRSPQLLVTDPAMKDGDAFAQCNIYSDAD